MMVMSLLHLNVTYIKPTGATMTSTHEMTKEKMNERREKVNIVARKIIGLLNDNSSDLDDQMDMFMDSLFTAERILMAASMDMGAPRSLTKETMKTFHQLNIDYIDFYTPRRNEFQKFTEEVRP
jgi:hypothetical protein